MFPARSAAASAARPAREWIELLARWGFLANAVVYLMVGALAVRMALGDGGRITDPEGALRTLSHGAGGNALLIALIPGFFSYTLWRVLAALFDGDDDGNSAAGIAARVFGVIKASAYAALGLTALRLARGTATVGDSEGISGVLGNPVVAFVIGAGVLAFAAFEMYRAWSSKLSDGLRLSDISARARHWIVGISRFGIGARAVVIGAVGFLMLRAVFEGRAASPTTTRSIHTVAQAEPALYFLIGAGLIAYGAYLVVLSKYRKVRTA